MTVHAKRIPAKPLRAVSPRMKGMVHAAALLLLACQCFTSRAQSDTQQSPAPETTEQKVERLATAVSQIQAQMEANQKLLLDLQKQLAALQQEMAAEKTSSPAAVAPTTPGTTPPVVANAPNAAPALDEMKERQAIDESQIATHELTKVETQSKYPLTVSGLILFNGFVNTHQVDIPAAPAYAVSGSGSTGFSPRQTVLGLDARGPHLFGATSHADLRIDFFANGSQSGYTAGGVLRLRTAHAGLKWKNTKAFFELDRPILEPNAPTSLLAVGQPELAWAGNLWAWNPQVGISHQFELSRSVRFQTQVALIDASDPHLPQSASTTSNVTAAESSRWPGTEARIAFLGGTTNAGPEVGIGGYFSPHHSADGADFNAWAATMDVRLPIKKCFEVTANAYRGQALGGLGGGGYVDYFDRYIGSVEVAQALDDVGGWAQLKGRAGQKMEFNAGYGIDNPFAKEIHSSILPFVGYYPGIAKNRSFFANTIYSPSTYLQFSLEYRRLWTNYAAGSTHFSDVIGIGAGYKF
jgi:hypothetical protein